MLDQLAAPVSSVSNEREKRNDTGEVRQEDVRRGGRRRITKGIYTHRARELLTMYANLFQFQS